jgi:hypothetical protein
MVTGVPPLYRLPIRIYPPGPRRADLTDTVQAMAEAGMGRR